MRSRWILTAGDVDYISRHGLHRLPDIPGLRFGKFPAATATIMVSPMARDIPRMKDAVIPESAAGTTTFVTVSYFVAPRAYAPSRKPAWHRVEGVLANGSHGRE